MAEITPDISITTTSIAADPAPPILAAPIAPAPVSVPISTNATIPSTSATQQPTWTLLHSLGALGTLIAAGVASWYIPSRLTSWIVIMVLLTLFIAITANGTTGRWEGALIDDRNTISLSRLQMAIWTTLILSALLAAGVANVKSAPLTSSRQASAASGLTTVGIAVPSNLLLLMGIATTSLIATPLILSTKANKPANDDEKQTTLDQLAKQRMNVSNVVNNGQLLSYTTADNARWADLFRGEEVGNAAHLDLGKIQLFYFTFILALVYGITLGALFASPQATIQAFPDIDTTMLTLLGISHAGYLVNKAIPHSSNP